MVKSIFSKLFWYISTSNLKPGNIARQRLDWAAASALSCSAAASVEATRPPPPSSGGLYSVTFLALSLTWAKKPRRGREKERERRMECILWSGVTTTRQQIGFSQKVSHKGHAVWFICDDIKFWEILMCVNVCLYVQSGTLTKFPCCPG